MSQVSLSWYGCYSCMAVMIKILLPVLWPQFTRFTLLKLSWLILSFMSRAIKYPCHEMGKSQSIGTVQGIPLNIRKAFCWLPLGWPIGVLRRQKALALADCTDRIHRLVTTTCSTNLFSWFSSISQDFLNS